MSAAEITLANLGGGAAAEKWQEEFAKVLKNIADPNTDPTTKREVVLKVSFKPNTHRDLASVKISAMANLAPNTAFPTQAHVGIDLATGKGIAYEDNPNQTTIQDYIDSGKGDNVTPIAPAPEETEEG